MMIQFIFTIILINSAFAIDVSPYFKENTGNGGLNGGIKIQEQGVGGVRIGGMMDSNGHSQGVSGGIRFDTGPNSHIDVGGFRGRGGNIHGGGLTWSFNF